MAITISGENNNDRILASDGVIDQISGINFSGIITASHINVGSNIQLGNAGIITATTFVGNITGNVNNTSPLLLQTGGYERFRITGNNELGIAGANYGSSGQVLTSGGSGSAVSWTTIPTQVSISGNANNRVITGGSGTNLVGESTLTYDGDGLLSMTSTSGSAEFTIVGPNNTDSGIYFNDGANDGAISYDHSARQLKFRAGGHTRMYFAGGNDSNNNVIYLANHSYDDGYLQYYNGGLYLKTGSSNGDRLIAFSTGGGERFRINSVGQITTNTTGTIFADINSSSSNGAYCNFDIGANGANIGYLGSANHLVGGGTNTDLAIRATNNFQLSTGGSTTKITITSTGQLTHNTSATVTTLNTTSSQGAYLHLNYGQSSALTGYIGAGSHLITGSAISDFGIRTANNLDISTGNATRRLSIRTGGYVNIGGDYTQSSRFVNINGGSVVGQLQLKGTEADLWLHSTGPGNTIWRVMGCTGNTTHKFRVYDQTNSADRFGIDSNGHVTKPGNFHILVDRDGNQTGYSATFPGDVIAWNRVRTSESSPNASNHFNTSTGIFTAPVTGLYHFHASVNCNFNCEGGWIVVNGSRPNFSTFYPNYAMSADGHLTYHLTAGDEVGLKWYQNGGSNRTINSNSLHTWWRIVLLG